MPEEVYVIDRDRERFIVIVSTLEHWVVRFDGGQRVKVPVVIVVQVGSLCEEFRLFQRNTLDKMALSSNSGRIRTRSSA